MALVQDRSIRNTLTVFGSRLVILIATALFASGCSFVSRSPFELGVKVESSKRNSTTAIAPAPRVKPLPEPVWQVTPEVHNEVSRLLFKERRHLEKTLSQMQGYRSIVEEIFEDEGVPKALVSLAFVESGFNPEARSPAGAVGMWQFMRPTAQNYGLKVSKALDQRKDPILSTIAAARHLRDLYNAYGDWHLALAAYNAGTGGVGRAMARSGHTDFWKIARSGKFSRQTKEFVPRIVAVSLIIEELESSDIGTLAQNLDWLRGGTDVESVRIANWTGDRRPSAG